jgi:hypothetical protein
LIVKKHVLRGNESIDVALVHLWNIHNEDITRPHMDASQVPEQKRPSLILMLYVFGNISIDEFIIAMTERIDADTDSMQRYKSKYV